MNRVTSSARREIKKKKYDKVEKKRIEAVKQHHYRHKLQLAD